MNEHENIVRKEQFERLENVRKHLQVNQSKFAAMVNITRSAYSKMKTGSRITLKSIEQLKKNVQVNPEYIFHGELPMFLETSINAFQSENKKLNSKYNSNITDNMFERLLLLLEQNNEYLTHLIKNIEIRDENESDLIRNLNTKEEINRINAITINNLASELLKNTQKLGGKK